MARASKHRHSWDAWDEATIILFAPEFLPGPRFDGPAYVPKKANRVMVCSTCDAAKARFPRFADPSAKRSEQYWERVDLKTMWVVP